MQEKPYFCPNCRSNRVKFSVIASYSQSFLKDALTGEVKETQDPSPVSESEPTIQCLVCSYVGNEMRFVKQAEREPRVTTETNPSYT
ncbi:hypothetical protein [Paenibacillus lutrae]|uniref:DNA alkylation repair protein n=1 Tax=Paenibacillus lutrae TaxID=2078573 RepID=A0A7X3FGE3_9BACL|nr:hypothetical protein [Paenibacillus lutrae]MVO99174.1 hypothetical protein [Paenibacillus lutrae]